MTFKPEAAATAIGSFPHKNPENALELIYRNLPQIPLWPQLPKISLYEDMNNQYSRVLPGYFIDEQNNKSGFNTGKDFPGELEKFYSKIIEGDIEYFGLEKKYSSGFGHFLKSVGSIKENLLALKGHVTGPLTHGLVTDTIDGKYAMYKPDLFDAIVKNCLMNARWQVEKLKNIFPQVIIFIDEPSLTVIGSGYYSVDKTTIDNAFSEIIQGIKDSGGIPGMHCCGNAQWDDILKLDLDILNFDAADELILEKFLNAKGINDYFAKEKIIAWGMIPTLEEKIRDITYDDIENNFKAILKNLTEKGLKESDILRHSIITPSCGTGSLSEELAEKALVLTKKLSDNLKGRQEYRNIK